MKMRRLDTSSPRFQEEFERLSAAAMDSAEDIERATKDIIASVRQRAMRRCWTTAPASTVWIAPTARTSSWTRTVLAKPLQPCPKRSARPWSTPLSASSTTTKKQLRQSWSYTDEIGNELGQRLTPLARVGVYVPGGQAAYPSTVLMTIIPARVAGVEEIAVTMPCPEGTRNPLVLAALHLVEVREAYAVGGAQAVAALAFGTETIRPVDKIVGPGGAWVAEAKRQVFGRTGIDLIAGPTEIIIIADGSAPVDWLVQDLFSQAEHDALAQSLLLCPNANYLNRIAERIAALLPRAARRDIIAQSLANRGALVQTRSLAEAVEVANSVAPEHLQLAVAEPRALLDGVRHAGAIFLGHHSPEAMGDYVAGPSHVLPTYGTARFSSPLGVDDFQKASSIIALSEQGAKALAQTASTLARGEGLEAHALAAEARGQ